MTNLPFRTMTPCIILIRVIITAFIVASRETTAYVQPCGYGTIYTVDQVADKQTKRYNFEPHFHSQYRNGQSENRRRGMMALNVADHSTFSLDSNFVLAADPILDDSSIELPSAATDAIAELGNNHSTDVAVFVLGIIPFLWASFEFWRRIAVGLPFGTGSDSVVIVGEDNNPSSSRGRRTLGKGALVVAYILFGLAAFTVGIAMFSVLSSPPTPGGIVPE